MIRFALWVGVVVGSLIAWENSALAARPSEALLPDTTKGAIFIGNTSRLQEHWDKSQFGQLTNDPLMQPFVEDLKRQLKKGTGQRLDQLGLTWEDLAGVPGGEVAVAVVQPAPSRAAILVIADVTGHDAEAKVLFDKIIASLKKQGAKPAARPEAGLTVYTRVDDEKKTHTAVLFLKNNILAASDDAQVLTGVLAASGADRKDSLAARASFKTVMARCKADAGELEPDIRWYLDPFGYVDAIRILNPPRVKHKGQDKLSILREQGFDAIQALGGFVNFSADRYEVLHRTAVYAPPVQGAKDKYKLAAAMLSFPNGADLKPQVWAPRDLAMYISFSCDLKTAFYASESLIDAVAGDKGVFQDVLNDLQNDPNGPKVDIRNEIVAHLSSRGTLMTDYQLPIDVKSERSVFAIEINDKAQPAVEAAIEKLFGGDPNVHKRMFGKVAIWEIVDKETSIPMVKIENVGFAPVDHADREHDEDAAKDKRVLRNSAVAVANGNIYVASHVDFLEKVLTGPKAAREQLGSSADYIQVMGEMDRLGAKAICGRVFSRTDEAYRPTYELIRQGKMPESETLLGKMLNTFLGNEGTVRPQRIEGGKLPDFDVARRYLGPAGTFITTEDDGWFVVGFALSKDLRETPEVRVDSARKN